jgi:RNA polymerase II elongation factor ELL
MMLPDSRPNANNKKPTKKPGNNTLLKPHRQGLFDQNKVVRSLPSSPSLAGMTPTPASRPTAHQLRQQALKSSLIHLLAVRAVSESYITKTLNCEHNDIERLLEKYGRPSRLDVKKFDLSDRGYKELDVWGFGYKEASDRQAAIDRAIAAFDRQRISVRESVWQMLLPNKERNKGKILSKLNLHTGPMERAKTPQIHVQSSGEGRTNGKTSPSDERPGRLAPSSAAGPRSSSQEPPNKAKVSDKEAQAKRLLSKSKKPNSTGPEASRKPEPKPAASTASTAPKKAPAKPSITSNSKFKSAEFVVSSDEETEVEDTPITLAKPAPRPAAKTTSKPKDSAKPAPKVNQGNGSAKSGTVAPKNGTTKATASASSNKLKAPDAESKSNLGVSSLPRKRALSSPHKPSRLGSSPPTNASDFENEAALKSKSSSSSNSPLINQRREVRKAPGHAPTSKPAATSSSSSDRPVKRKSEAISSDRSAAPREREREREREPQRGSSTQPPPAKRRLTASPQPAMAPRSTTPSEAATPAHTPRPLSSNDLQSARRFKEMQLRYAMQLKELRADSNPSADRVERLRRMYSKLSEHKRNLSKLVAT